MFTLKKVVNANEILVEPNWFHKGYEGDRVFIKGFLLPTEGFGSEYALQKLEIVLKDAKFELRAPEFYEPFGKEIVACIIFMDGIYNIKSLFPEFEPENFKEFKKRTHENDTSK